MTFACPPLLRVALHALLGLAVLLQASLAVAMHASPVGTNPVAPEPTAHHGHAASTPAVLPPCHVLAAVAVGDVPAATPADCCNDEALGESCRWACAQALNLPTAMLYGAARPHAAAEVPAPLLPALRWAALSPLRPPIG